MACVLPHFDCSICYGLDVENAFFRRERLRKVTRSSKLCKVGEILASACKGCPGCDLICKGIPVSAERNRDRVVHIIFEVGLPLRVEGEEIDVEFYVSPGISASNNMVVAFLMILDKPAPGPCVGPATHLSKVLNSEEAAKFARGWLRRCQEEHKICRSTQSFTHGTTLPKRVLDVGFLDGPRHLSLVEPGGSSGDYIALSYCWGVDHSFITTAKNIPERLSGIVFEELPRTFQDAVAMTRHMGVRYLWIDALCIIQDDKEDWDTEAANMQFIYGGSLLTLSATCSRDVNQGFLGARSSWSNFPFRKSNLPISGDGIYTTSWTMPTGLEVPVYVRQRLAHSVIVSQTADTEDYPLLRRGWAFQERLLATRTLHFLSQELVWECRCRYWCECAAIETDQMWKSDSMRGSIYNKVMSDSETVNVTAAWQSLIMNYSKRFLTRESDRLPALSGIAHRFSRLGMGSYLAGMWRKNLLWYLVWQADHVSSQIGHYEQPRLSDVTESPETLSINMRGRSPSWSWISTLVPIKWNDDTFRTLDSSFTGSEVVDVSCELDGPDPMAGVLAGKLLLKARVTSASIQSIDNNRFVITKWGWHSTSAVLIPDLPAFKCGLIVGNSLHCVHMFSYKKDDEHFWVALAVQRVDDPQPTSSNLDPQPTSSNLDPQPTSYNQVVRLDLSDFGLQLDLSDLELQQILSNLANKSQATFHDGVDEETRQSIIRAPGLICGGAEPASMRFSDKILSNSRPVYSPPEDIKDNNKETFARVGLIEGRHQSRHYTNWFDGIQPREIFII